MPHTKTPWTVPRFYFNPAGDMYEIRVYGASGAVAVHSQNINSPADIDEAKANAKLIAASPDLLSALREVTDALSKVDDYGSASGGLSPDVQNDALDKAREVISRAT